MKRIVAIALALMMLCSASALAETVTGTAQGFGGDVTVAIELTEGKVSNVTVEGAGETPEVGGKAIETYNETLTELFKDRLKGFVNPSEVKAVSGATITSAAVQNAVAQAVGLEARSGEKIAKDTTSVNMEALAKWLADRNNVSAAQNANVFLRGEQNAPPGSSWSASSAPPTITCGAIY